MGIGVGLCLGRVSLAAMGGLGCSGGEEKGFVELDRHRRERLAGVV